MLQKKQDSQNQGENSLKAENLPLYFFQEENNKIVKVQKDYSMVCYQIIKYETGEIIHNFSMIPSQPLTEVEKELENFQKSTFDKFKEVAASYHQKERENAELVRKQMFKIKETLEPIIVKPEWITIDKEGNITVTLPASLPKTNIKATFIIY